MLTVINIVARFPARGQFHPVNLDGARASLALGCRRMGCGQHFKIQRGVHVTVVFGFAGLAGPVAGTLLGAAVGAGLGHGAKRLYRHYEDQP